MMARKYAPLYMETLAATSVRRLLYIVAFLVFAACSQSVDEVRITRTGPPRTFIPNSDLTGATSVVPVSPSLVMSIHSAGAGGLRTSSTSPSRRMTSGIGVD